MTTWHWVRHGPTHEPSFVGWRDVPADLSDTGLIQRVRGHLPASAVLVSSDLIRSVATADALSGADHHRLPHEPNLREINFGAWDGMQSDEVAKRDPVLSKRFWKEPGDIQAPEGESWNQTAIRVNTVVDRLTARYPERDIIAVAHFGVILTQVQRALELTPRAVFAHKIDNISVTTLHHSAPDRWQVGQINHVP